MVSFVLQSQMLGAYCLLYLASAADDIGVDGTPPAEVGLLQGGNSKTLAEIAHRSFYSIFLINPLPANVENMVRSE